MSRDTLVTDQIRSKGGGVVILGGPSSTTQFSDLGTITLGGTATLGVPNGTGISLTGTGGFTVENAENFIAHGVPRIKEVAIDYTDFTAATPSDTADFTVESAYDFVITDVFVRKGTAWTGGSVSAVDIKVGLPTDDDAYILTARIDLFSGTGVEGTQPGDRGASIDSHGEADLQTTNNDIRVTITTTGGNCADLTQGDATLYVRFFTIPN